MGAGTVITGQKATFNANKNSGPKDSESKLLILLQFQ
jgi:hypothetical protein